MRWRRVLRAVEIVLLVVDGLIALLAGTVLAADLSGVPRREMLRVRAQLEQLIGRPVSFGTVSLSLWPAAGMELHDLTIAQNPGDLGPQAPPLLYIRSIRAYLSVPRLVLSLGRDVHVPYAEIEGLTLNAVRHADGGLTCQDVLTRLREALDRMPRPPLSAQAQRRLRGLSLGQLSLTRAALHMREEGRSGDVVRIDQIEIVGNDLRVEHAVGLSLDAAVNSAVRNLRLEATLTPVPTDLLLDLPDLFTRVALRLQPLPLQPLLFEFLPDTGLWPESGTLAADLVLERPLKEGRPDPYRVRLMGTADASQLVLRYASSKGGPLTLTRGAPADAHLNTNLEADLIAGDVLVRALDLDVSGMALHGVADIRKLWGRREHHPAVNQLALSSRGLTLEKLLSLVPGNVLPDGAVLRGPLSVSASAYGPAAAALLQADVDLTGATLIAPWLHKPAGMVCSVQFRGQLVPPGIAIERMGAQVGPLLLWLNGRVHSPSDVDLKMDSGPLALDRVLRLAPQVERTVHAHAVLRGTTQVQAGLRHKGDDISAGAHVLLRGAQVAMKDFVLRGSGEVQAQFHSSPEETALSVRADLTDAQVWVPKVLDKGRGALATLRVSVLRHGHQVVVQEAALRLPGGALDVRGGADLKRSHLDLDAPQLLVDTKRLGVLFPVLWGRDIPDARLRLAVHADGDPLHMGGVRLVARALSLQALGGSLSGTAEVEAVDPPRRIRFDLRGDDLDLDRLLRAAPTWKRPAGTQAAPGASQKFWRSVDWQGRLHLSRVAVQGALLQNLDLDAGISGGKLTVRRLRMAGFGGTAVVSGSSADLSTPEPEFAVHARVLHVQLRPLMAILSPRQPNRLEGVVSIEADLRAHGATTAAINASLTGTAGVTLTDGVVRSVTVRARINNPGLKGLVGPDGLSTMHRDEFPLGALTARFTIGGGRLHLAEPLRFANQQLLAKVTGDISLDDQLALTVDMEILPHGFDVATRGKIVPAAAVPVDTRVVGDGRLPTVTIDHLDDTVAAMMGGLLGDERAPEIRPPRPVPGEPGADVSNTTVRPVLPRAQRRDRQGPFMVNIKIGPSFGLPGAGLSDLPNQLVLQVDLGVAVTPNYHGYLVLPLQMQLLSGVTALMVPLGFQYDIALPIRSLYLYPRVSLGYAALFGTDQSGVNTLIHAGVAIPEIGLKYVPIKRFNFGIEPLSLPVIFTSFRVSLAYRLLFYAGVNF